MAKKNNTFQKEKSRIRQPIVAVMGHVDHGKTTFLDAIRNTRVAEKEVGGITQNTRAHEVTTKSGFKITFIDTPGHEAFSKMRERGARVTDFVLLVVAADDGLQPQTKESIAFAKENNVPIIVAVNKIDLPGVNTLKIKQELASFDVQIEEYGGEVMYFEISAKNKTGLDEVLEAIELLCEVNGLKEHQPKEGVIGEAFVLESQLDKRMGYSALAILKSGNLTDRYFGVTADSVFKVRAYMNEAGKPVQKVNISQPFTILGLEKDLTTGEIINFVDNERDARKLQADLKSGDITEDEGRSAEGEKDAESIFAQLLMQKHEEETGAKQKELPVVIKASTQGTLEAVIAEIEKLETEASKVKIVQSGTGNVSEDDINMAKATGGIVLAFQITPDNKVTSYARQNKVILRKYEIIYELIDEIADVLDGMDMPREQEIFMSTAKVKQVFTLSDGSQVAGCEVANGKFLKGYQVKAFSPSELDSTEPQTKGKSKVISIRQGKNEVKEVKKGQECGMLLNPSIEELEEGDIIVAYRVEKA
ncbi:MAG: hypothetical protein Kow0081_3490 [Candidatus Dojkabacteria bacterium]